MLDAQAQLKAWLQDGLQALFQVPSGLRSSFSSRLDSLQAQLQAWLQAQPVTFSLFHNVLHLWWPSLPVLGSPQSQQLPKFGTHYAPQEPGSVPEAGVQPWGCGFQQPFH